MPTRLISLLQPCSLRDWYCSRKGSSRQSTSAAATEEAGPRAGCSDPTAGNDANRSASIRSCSFYTAQHRALLSACRFAFGLLLAAAKLRRISTSGTGRSLQDEQEAEAQVQGGQKACAWGLCQLWLYRGMSGTYCFSSFEARTMGLAFADVRAAKDWC